MVLGTDLSSRVIYFLDAMNLILVAWLDDRDSHQWREAMGEQAQRQEMATVEMAEPGVVPMFSYREAGVPMERKSFDQA